MTPSVSLSTPNIPDTALSLVPIAGAICYPLKADGSQVAVEVCTSFDDPSSGQDQDPALIQNILNPVFTVRDGTGAVIKAIPLPEKQARTAFRFPWLTSTVVQTNLDLIAQHLVFPIGDPGAQLRTPDPVTYDGPNDFPDMVRYEGQTGESDMIGLFSEHAAVAIRTGDFSQALIIAEGASTAPLIFQDKSTGKPIDKLKYPKCNNYGGGPNYRGRPWMKPADANFASDPNIVYPNIAHYPEASYVAAMATFDPWHLRNLQMAATNCLLTDGDAYVTDWSTFALSPMIMASPETRAFAWELRTVAMAEVATREFEKRGILPANCMPSAYFTQVLANIRQYYIAVRMADPDKQLLRIFETDGGIDPWQVEYQLETLAFMVLTDHTDWNDTFLWALKNPIDRTSGDSGWPACLPAVYYIWIGAAGARFPSWAAIWNNHKLPSAQSGQLGQTLTQQQLDMVNADQFNSGYFPPQQDGDYPMETHGVLSMALYLHQIGKLNVLSVYPELTKCWANLHRMFVAKEAAVVSIYGHGNWFFNNRDAESFDQTKFTLTPSSFPQQLPANSVTAPASPIPPNPAPPPPNPQPPAGALHMAGTGNLTIGQTAQVLLSWDDGHGNPSDPPTNLIYSESPAGVVSLAVDATGVNVTGLVAGAFTVTATANGGLTASISGAVALPLAAALHLAWA